MKRLHPLLANANGGCQTQQTKNAEADAWTERCSTLNALGPGKNAELAHTFIYQCKEDEMYKSYDDLAGAGKNVEDIRDSRNAFDFFMGEKRAHVGKQFQVRLSAACVRTHKQHFVPVQSACTRVNLDVHHTIVYFVQMAEMVSCMARAQLAAQTECCPLGVVLRACESLLGAVHVCNHAF